MSDYITAKLKMTSHPAAKPRLSEVFWMFPFASGLRMPALLSAMLMFSLIFLKAMGNLDQYANKSPLKFGRLKERQPYVA